MRRAKGRGEPMSHTRGSGPRRSRGDASPRCRRRRGSRGCRGGRDAEPVRARSPLGARFVGAALAIETEPEMTRARRAVLVVRAPAGGAGAVETEAPAAAVRVPRAFFLAWSGAAVAVARTGNEKANASDAAAVIGGARRLVVAETAAARLAFAGAARPFDASGIASAIPVRAAAGFALAVDTGLTRRAGIGRVAALRLRRFRWLTARVGAGDGDGEHCGVNPLRVG